MSTRTPAPAYSILSTFSKLVDRQMASSTAGLALGQVSSPHPSNPMVQIQGYDGAIEVLLPDWFDLVPLVRGDLVTLGQLPGGDWIVLTRLSTGSVSGINLSVGMEQLETPVLQLGSPFTDDGDESPGRLQWGELPATVFNAGTVTPVTWNYPSTFTAPPIVVATIQATALGGHFIRVWISAVDEFSATFGVANDYSTNLTANLLALAIGPV